MARGLERRSDQPAVTTSRDGAALYGRKRDWTAPKVLEIHVPSSQAARYLGEPEQGTPIEGTVHPLRETLPPSFIRAVHEASTAMPRQASSGDRDPDDDGWDALADEIYDHNHPEYQFDPPSASEEYWNPPHLYHGTSEKLKPGDLVEGGHPSNFDKPRGHLDHGYAAPSVESAAGYAEIAAARRGGHPRVYEVGRAHDMMPDPETGAAFGIDSTTIAHPDWRSKEGFPVLRELHPSEFEHHLIEDWPEMHGHTAARWQPSSGIFAPTTGLDSRLFDGHHRLRPATASAIMERLDRCLRTESGLTGSEWQEYLRVYLAGGSASEWAGNRPNDAAQDLDVLIGVDYARIRARCRDWAGGLTDADIDARLNTALRAHFNDADWHPDFGGAWSLTGYVNPRAYDIRVIKPYAAWDLSDARWAVRPPHLPEHTLADFDPAVIAQARAVAAEARAILKMPEPLRTREATALWERLHAERRQAFSDAGTGWTDPGNVAEKWIAYAPGNILGKIRELALVKTAASQDYSYEHLQPPSKRVHWVNAYHPDGHRVGDMTWKADGDHHVTWIAVYDKNERRKGIATGMWNKAREVDPLVSHNSAEDGQTEDGRNWAEKTAARPGARWTDWARQEPHKAVIHQAQQDMRESGEHPELIAPLDGTDWGDEDSAWHARRRDSPEGTEAMRKILRAAGHPDAGRAWVGVHPDPKGSSQVAMDSETGAPGAVLLPERWQNLTVAHEAAHLVHAHESGIALADMMRGEQPGAEVDSGIPDHVMHGPEFARHMANALDVLSPGAGDDFARHHATAVTRVGNARFRIHGEPREFAGGMHMTAARTREEQLAAMDPATRASALAQEHVRLMHPKTTLPLHEKNGQNNHSMTQWLKEAGVPRAEDSYVAMHQFPDRNQSNSGRGPDGEPCVILHPDKWDYGTMGHETAHLITDHQTGRGPGQPHGPEGVHGDQWAVNYAHLLNKISKDAGSDFLAERRKQLDDGLAAEASFETASPDAADQRRERVDRWLDRRGTSEFALPERWAPAAQREDVHAIMDQNSGGYFPDEHWEHLPVRDVSLRQKIHQTQQHVTPEGVREKIDEDFDGEPAYGDDYGEGHDLGGPDPKIVLHQGQRYLMDGHHRFARGRLMGYDSMPSRFYDTADPSHDPRNCEQCADGDDDEYLGSEAALHTRAARSDLEFSHSDFDDIRGRIHRIDAYHPEHGEVGYAETQEREGPGGPHVELHRLWTNREHRGTGVGSALIGEVERHHQGSELRLKPWPEDDEVDEDDDDYQDEEDLRDYYRNRGFRDREVPEGEDWRSHGYMTKQASADVPWTNHHLGEGREVTAAREEGGTEDWGPGTTIRMVPPEEYGKFVYPDYPKARTPQKLADHFRRTNPGYFQKLRDDIEANGVHAPVLVRYTQPNGRPLARPRVMDGHHRAAAAYDLGVHIPVGDYDNNADYDASAAQPARRQWFSDNWELKEQGLPPWRRHSDLKSEAASGYTDLTKRSGMIYLEIPEGLVRQVPGGVDDHHITLVYLGKNVSDEEFAEACRRARQAAAQCPPLEGLLRGVETFEPSGSSDGKVPAFVPAYVPGIGKLRALLEDLSASEHRLYRPHVTLAYLEPDEDLPEPHPRVPVSFSRLYVKRGDDVVSFPLGTSQ